MELTPDAVADQLSKTLGSCKVLLTQNEIPPASTDRAISVCAPSSAEAWPVVVANPAPAPERLSAGIVAGADVLVLNDSEARALAPDAPETLLPRRPGRGRVLLLTRGGEGSTLFMIPPAESSAPIRSVYCGAVHFGKVIDTVGAGDAFVGALAASLSTADSASAALSDPDVLLKAVKVASTVAGMSVCKPGTQSSYPTREQVDTHFPTLV
jgi:ribokinase